jgi:transaldolase
MNSFFIDTADIEYVIYALRQLWGNVDSKQFLGITTNPSAFYKANILTIADAVERVKELCKAVTAFRQDGLGVVYIQPPSTKMTINEIEQLFSYFNNCSDGYTHVKLKLPPNIPMLTHFCNNNIYGVNVTGLADCSTANMAISYKPEYISVIMGRMEENNINTEECIEYIKYSQSGVKIITGAMRTVDGLKRACNLYTIPTIGPKVMDLVFSEVGAKYFNTLWNITECKKMSQLNLSPLITSDMINLSKAFFDQMDNFGNSLYEDFIKMNKFIQQNYNTINTLLPLTFSGPGTSGVKYLRSTITSAN